MDAEATRLHINSGSSLTEGFGLPSGPVPLEPYRSPAFFELERERIFRRAWLVVGRVEEVPEAGSFILRQVDPCDVSALVTRSKAGHIQAFHNSCSHRGSAIVSAPAGRQGRFVCPYHKWTYGEDGRLLGVSDEADFPGLDKAKCGLKPIATEVWEGWIFINLGQPPEVDLATFLGPFRDHLAGLSWLGCDGPVTFSAELEANWKVVSDAFIESYHLLAIHPQSLAPTFASDTNPYGRFLSARRLGPHQAVSYPGNAGYVLNPAHRVEALAAGVAETGSVIAVASREAAAGFLSHPAVNPTRSNTWSMDTNALFPNIHIDTGPGGIWTHQFWPLAPHRTRDEGRFYMAAATSMRERFQQEAYIARLGEIVLEDLANVARTQAGINSGGQTEMQLKDSEVGIRHALAQVIRWTEAPSVVEALA